tara:strand:- start:564 stop:854 length:291 start_codon:yes stop_codon:yes gene_type:complete
MDNMDFKELITQLEDLIEDHANDMDSDELLKVHVNLTALRIADRLQSGEVSGDMVVSAISRGEGEYVSMYPPIFKAMAGQLIEECKTSDAIGERDD